MIRILLNSFLALAVICMSAVMTVPANATMPTPACIAEYGGMTCDLDPIPAASNSAVERDLDLEQIRDIDLEAGIPQFVFLNLQSESETTTCNSPRSDQVNLFATDALFVAQEERPACVFAAALAFGICMATEAPLGFCTELAQSVYAGCEFT